MSTIQVTPQELNQIADLIDGIWSDLDERMLNIYNQMMSLENDGFDTPSGVNLRLQFANFRASVLNNYPQAMASYSTFLRNTATRYASGDATIQSQLDEIPDSIMP